MCSVLPVFFPSFHFALLHLLSVPLDAEPINFCIASQIGPTCRTELESRPWQGQSVGFCCQVPTGRGTGNCFAKQTLLNTALVINSESIISLKALETEDEGDALTFIQLCHWGYTRKAHWHFLMCKMRQNLPQKHESKVYIHCCVTVFTLILNLELNAWY